MKKTALLAASVLALVGARLESGVERAGHGDLAGGDVRSRAHFRASYENPFGGHWTCSGIRLVINGPGSRVLTKDTEQCTITDLSTFPPGTYRGGPFYVINGVTYTWASDYDGITAVGVNLIVTDNGDGTGHVEVDAYY